MLRCERSSIVVTLPLPRVVTWFSLATDGTYNNSLDRRGDGVFLNLIGAAQLE
jgi:hypothetical protein